MRPAGEAALFLLGIFDRQRMSPGIAAAKTDTVEKAQNHQKPIGGDADLGIAGNERDQKRDDAKARDRRDRRRAAPEAIRHDAKRERPNRARPSSVVMNTSDAKIACSPGSSRAG